MKPLVLIILDGWGIAPDGPGNAISQIKTNTIQSLWNTYPHTQLLAAGTAVGLPSHEPGNSETGHINIGAGRIVDQDLTRIHRSIADGSFSRNEAFLHAIEHVRTHRSSIHILGLLTDTGVHASLDHLGALIRLLQSKEVMSMYLHLQTDGRDSPPTSAKHIYADFIQKYPEARSVHVATIMGRYYGMDRDRRWERTERAYNALTDTAEYHAKSFTDAIDHAYKRHETDEFIKPTIITDASGVMYPRITDNDAVIFFNYRVDRPRQLTRALTLPDFESHNFSSGFNKVIPSNVYSHSATEDERSKPFTRAKQVKNICMVTLTEYEPNPYCVVAYPPKQITDTIAAILAKNNIHQLHASESEKERFVTYYFNGLVAEPFPYEDRLIVLSPNVSTYDKKPNMSAEELTNKLIEKIDQNFYQFIVINYANPDMVGHSGSIPATISACETVDAMVKLVVDKVLSLDGTCIITADHGHAEEMLSPQGDMLTEHTANPVPFILCDNRFVNHNIPLPPGVLGDIGPTILSLLHIPIPPSMSGHNLYPIDV